MSEDIRHHGVIKETSVVQFISCQVRFDQYEVSFRNDEIR